MGQGHFDGIGDTEIYEQGIYLDPGGGYDVAVVDMLVKFTRKKVLLFILEMEIVKSTSDKHAVGSKATWMQKLGPDAAMPNIKKMLIGLMCINMKNKEEKETFNSECEQILNEATEERVDEEGNPRFDLDDKGEVVLDSEGAKVLEPNPLAGHKVHVDTHTTVMDNGGDFTVHTWSPYKE